MLKPIATHQDYILIRIDPKTQLRIWVKVPPKTHK